MKLLDHTLTSPFGKRASFLAGGVQTPSFHDGVDFGVPQGTVVTLPYCNPQFGSFSGVVVYAGLDGGGNAYAQIKADNMQYSCRLVHLSRIDVKKGDRIKEGDKIGLSGGAYRTWGAGSSTGSHVHFTVVDKNNVAVSPLPFLDTTKNRTLNINNMREQVIDPFEAAKKDPSYQFLADDEKQNVIDKSVAGLVARLVGNRRVAQDRISKAQNEPNYQYLEELEKHALATSDWSYLTASLGSLRRDTKQLSDDLLYTMDLLKKEKNNLKNEIIEKPDDDFLTTSESQPQQKFSLNIAGIDLARNGWITGLLTIVFTTGVGYVVGKVPELAPYQTTIINYLLGLGGIAVTGQNINNFVKSSNKK